jgi:4-diphosphocytidyl-2-C-methyl-D-erythritol kinase
MLYRCYAKINLTLEVFRRRDDGFHDLASLVHTIGLADDLRVEPSREIVSRVESLAGIEDNLVTRAAHLLAEATRARKGADLTLVKRIPTAAGLGGGSSDAATTLVALNRLWDTRLSTPTLARLATQLGSDVPFFLRGGAAVLRGRGDVLEPVLLPPVLWLALAVPSQSVPNKTATLYRALEPGDFSAGETTAEAVARLRAGLTLSDSQLCNAFQRAARATFPGLDGLWGQLEAACGQPFHLSGAGPALFSLARDRAHARDLAVLATRPGVTGYAVRTVRRGRASVSLNDSAAIGYPKPYRG